MNAKLSFKYLLKYIILAIFQGLVITFLIIIGSPMIT